MRSLAPLVESMPVTKSPIYFECLPEPEHRRRDLDAFSCVHLSCKHGSFSEDDKLGAARARVDSLGVSSLFSPLARRYRLTYLINSAVAVLKRLFPLIAPDTEQPIRSLSLSVSVSVSHTLIVHLKYAT